MLLYYIIIICVLVSGCFLVIAKSDAQKRNQWKLRRDPMDRRRVRIRPIRAIDNLYLLVISYHFNDIRLPVVKIINFWTSIALEFIGNTPSEAPSLTPSPLLPYLSLTCPCLLLLLPHYTHQ